MLVVVGCWDACGLFPVFCFLSECVVPLVLVVLPGSLVTATN